MRLFFRNIKNWVGLVVVLVLLVAGSGCKSKKKAMEAAAAKAEQEQAASLRKQQEEMKKKEAEEIARKEAEAKEATERTSAPYAKLEQYFSAIASASNVTSANNSIQEVLTLFASEETPVLIVISEEGGQKDYDKPTTIKAYLHYLKDQRKNLNRIRKLQYDAAGRIKEIELIKQ